MNPLYLSGWDVKIKVTNIEDQSELHVKDGRQPDGQELTYVFRPRQFPYNAIILETHSGYVSLQALHWLSRNNIPVFMMNYDGAIMNQILPPIPIKPDLRKAQWKTTENPKKKLGIAKALVEAKIQRSLQVLEWLGQRYNIQPEIAKAKREAEALSKAVTVTRLRTVEGRVALRYWEAFFKALPKSLRFQGRMSNGHNMNAVDPVNLALNYAYGFLKCECRMAVNAVGLESGVGFLHEESAVQTRESLVYDLQEPFRWLCDLAVISAFESGKLNAQSFYFAEQDYSYHFDTQAKGKLLDVLRETFNGPVTYKGRRMTWGFLIREKAVELGRYLKGQTPTIEFNEPNFSMTRLDGKAVREKILALAQSEAKEQGIGKSQLHYLRKKARGERSFKLYGKTKQKLSRQETTS